MTRRQFHAPLALTPEGWARDVAIDVNEHGYITAVTAAAPPEASAIRLAGPTLPGSVNIHSHTFQRAMAGLAERSAGRNDSFWSWRERMYSLVQRLNPEQVGAIASYSMIQMLKRGYTALTEFHYLHHAADGGFYADRAEMAGRILGAAEAAGLPTTLLPTLYSYGDFGGQPANSGQRRFLHSVDDFLKLLDTVDGRLGLQQTQGLAFHSLRAVTPAQIHEVLAARPETGPIHIHIAEQMREVEACQAWSGQRPVQWLFEHLPIDERWCLIHATHVDASELALLASGPATVGLCPTTEASLGDGIFPASELIDQGGRFAVGSDSQVCLGPLAELRLLEYGQRLSSQQRNRLHDGGEVGDTIYRMAATAGAQAAAQATGALEVGRRADFVVLDPAEPMLAGCAPEQITSCWLFAGDDRWVRDVWVAGQQIISEGHHPLETEAAQAMTDALAELAES
ncbi:formimidoylglutamate deiminase [Salinisphaera sp. SPP-AMP-43]|uniref:formimidoylglutamate deiminase n=1 Tax=Salinisphaera sp. SPP-AMP-43 TaxID=3121288 RepID=UPI003C6E8ACE